MAYVVSCLRFVPFVLVASAWLGCESVPEPVFGELLDASSDSASDASGDAIVDAPGDSSCKLERPSGEDADCNACLEGGCCAQTNKCTANSECVAILTCIRACSMRTGACANGCRSAHPQGESDYAAVASCGVDSCRTQCR